MKVILSVFAFVLIMSACTKVTVVKTTPNGKVPPGKMKKATGSQSAKPYAPGQQKQAPGASPGNSGNAPGQQKQKKK